MKKFANDEVCKTVALADKAIRFKSLDDAIYKTPKRHKTWWGVKVNERIKHKKRMKQYEK